MKYSLNGHKRIAGGAVILIGGLCLMGCDRFIPGRELIPGIALAIMGNQFIMCDRIIAAVSRIEAPTNVEKQHWIETGKGIGFREARRTPRPVSVLRPRNELNQRPDSISS